jgi:hypothetical protein
MPSVRDLIIRFSSSVRFPAAWPADLATATLILRRHRP